MHRQAPSCRVAAQRKDKVVRHVRENNVNDVAADVESLRGQWLDHLGRHGELLSASDYYAAAAFRGIGDSPEIRLLVGGGVGVDLKILEDSPSTISISLIAKSAPMHRRAPFPNASHAGAGLLGVPEAVRIESFGVREDFRILVQIGEAYKDVVIVRIRQAPRSKCGALTWRPGKSMTGRTRNTSKIVARRKSLPPSSNFSDQLGQHVRVAPQSFERPTQGRCCGLVTGTDEGHQFVADVLPGHPGSVGRPAAQ